VAPVVAVRATSPNALGRRVSDPFVARVSIAPSRVTKRGAEASSHPARDARFLRPSNTAYVVRMPDLGDLLPVIRCVKMQSVSLAIV
jgi:hypothetical protein